MPFYRFIDSDVDSGSGSDVPLERTRRQSGKQSPPPRHIQEPDIIDLASDESDAGREGHDTVHDAIRERGMGHVEDRADVNIPSNGPGGEQDMIHKQHSHHEVRQHTGDLVDSGIFIPELAQEQGQGIPLNDKILDVEHQQEGDILSSFMMNGVHHHKTSSPKDNRWRGLRSANDNIPNEARPIKVSSKDVDKILARPRRAPENMVSQHGLQTNRDTPYGDLVISDVPSGEAASKVANTHHQARTTPAATRTPSAPRSPQTPLPYDCQQCRMYDRPCNGMIPCFSCMSHGQGKKCVYRGGRGGGSSGAKALSKLSAQKTPQPALTQSASALSRPEEPSRTSASHSVPKRGGLRQSWMAEPRPILPAPSTPTITKVRMKNRDPADARQVRCEGCISLHRPCDGMLPCQRCENRVRKGVRACSYSARRFVRATVSPDAEVAKPNSGRAVAQREAARPPPSPPAPVSMPPAPQRSAPVTQDEVLDSDSDDQQDGDIPFKDEDDLDGETIDIVATTNEPAPVPPHEVEHRSPSTTAKKRRFSEVSQDEDDEGPPLESRQFNQRRSHTNLEAADPTWTPEWANINRRVTNRPTTRLSASTRERRSHATARTGGSAKSDRTADDRSRRLKPEHVPDMVKEMLASAREDIVLDVAPPGTDPLESLSPPHTKSGGRMNNLEAMLVQREKLDAAALRRALETIQQDPSSGWARMTEQEREHMAAQRRRELMEQRDNEGSSASYLAGQLLDLATSCVGPDAMLGYLMQSRRAKLKVIGLLDGLVQYDWNDGKLKVPANHTGRRG